MLQKLAKTLAKTGGENHQHASKKLRKNDAQGGKKVGENLIGKCSTWIKNTTLLK